MKESPRGVYVAMVTPMHEDESINHEELGRQVDRFADAGVDALFALGTNGEFYALSYQEKLDVLATVIEAAGGRLPVCAGVGCVTTAETIALAADAERLGVQSLSVITPYFAALSQEQLSRHFRAVAKAVALPLILYNIPQRTGNTIEPATVGSLSEVPNIAGVKDSSGRLESVRAFLDAAPKGFSVMAGTDSLILPGLKAGASGTVSGLANVVPELVVEIYRCWCEGRIAEAEAAQEAVVQVRSVLSLGNPNTVTKRATHLRGFPVGPCRAPASGLPPAIDDQIRKMLAEIARKESVE